MKPLRPFQVMIFLFLCIASAQAHEAPRIPVILDTDVALDDIRALTLLLQSEGAEVLAVVTSDGACAPEQGARNILRVLHSLEWTGIPVAAGMPLNRPSPDWRPMSEALGWSELIAMEMDLPQATATILVSRVLDEFDDTAVYLCLGPLTNIADALEADPSLVGKISVLYYSGSSPFVELPSWNTARDLDAAKRVFNSGMAIRTVQVDGDDLLTFSRSFLQRIQEVQTPAATFITRIHQDDRVLRLVEAEHMQCWDEMAVISFLEPDLFTFRGEPEWPHVMSAVECDENAVRQFYLKLLGRDTGGGFDHREAVVLDHYPSGPELLREDVRPLASAIIEAHGLAEWEAALITNEMHRHLGVYSLVGVKMGIRALELLDAGLDELVVISRAGSGPPLSCLTDGLQVATGASLGRGSISVDTLVPEPAAVFIKGGKRLTLRLKEDVYQQIQEEFRREIEEHGNLTPEYWKAIRASALQHWLDLDRRHIFEEHEQ